jgi:hypothetical protein
MTVRQLERTQKLYLAEFDRAVKRRRSQLVSFFKKQIKVRKTVTRSNDPKAVAMKKKMHNYLYYSVMNNVGRSGCAHWYKSKGNWVTKHSRKCEA